MKKTLPTQIKTIRGRRRVSARVQNHCAACLKTRVQPRRRKSIERHEIRLTSKSMKKSWAAVYILIALAFVVLVVGVSANYSYLFLGLVGQVIPIARLSDVVWLVGELRLQLQNRTKLRIIETLSDRKHHSKQEIQQTLERDSIVIWIFGVEDALTNLVLEEKVDVEKGKYVVVGKQIAVPRKRRNGSRL